MGNKRNRERKCDHTRDDALLNLRLRLSNLKRQCREDNIERTSNDNVNRDLDPNID